MSSRSRFVAARGFLAAGFLAAAGCGMNAELAAPAPQAVQAPPKHIQVQLATFDHDIHFAPGSRQLTSAQATGLAGFLTSNEIREGDAVTVDSGNGATALVWARRTAVLSGLRAFQIRATTGADPELAPDTIRVHADHTVVTAPNCPDWSKPETDEPNNAPSSNYGCADQANLAAMIANPADLVKPKDGGKTDAVALAHGAEIYRAGNLAKTLATSNGYSTGGLSGVSGPPASGGSSQ